MKKFLFFLLMIHSVQLEAWAQAGGDSDQEAKITVVGTVSDSESEVTIPGVSVLEKDTQNGVITNFDGEYSIVVPSDAILVFSYLGYSSIEVPVNDRSEIIVELEVQASDLEEVVVVGYGTQRKINLTGAVSSVDSDVLESRPITSVGQGLQGIVPNLNVTVGSGLPGSGASFNVRGGTSINGGGPLVLVDGVQMDPNLVNPDNIASVSVLKDAASAAIYGARAAYGVILITTKDGRREQAPRISYSGMMSFNSPTRMPEYMNSLDYVNMMNIANRNSGGGAYFNDDYVANVENYLNNPIPENSVFLDPSNPDRYLYSGNTDWIDAIYDDYSINTQHNVNVSGGSEKTSYYAALGMLDQGGLLTHFDEEFKRYNVNLNVDTDVTDWLNFSARASYNHNERRFPNGNEFADGETYGFISSDLRPLMPVRHPDGNFSGQGNFTNNAALLTHGGAGNRKINDLWLTGALQIQPVEGVLFNFDYTSNFYSNVRKSHRKEYMEHYANPDLETVYPWTTPSSAGLDQSDDYYNALNLWGQYENTFGKHYAKAMIGFNQEFKHTRWFSASRDNLINNDLGAINQATGENYVDASEGEWAIRGAFYRFNYIYDDKYLVELSGRYDGTSKFPKNDRFKFFPSVSVGWRLSEESFVDFIKPLVNDLKFRASYGSLGNQDLEGNYPYIASLGSSAQAGYIFDGRQPVSIHPAGLVSSSLTWETVKQYNLGLDLRMFNNRFQTTFDIYTRITEDMLTPGRILPSIIGVGVPNENAADLETKGWELSLTWRDRINDELNYNVGLVLSDYQTEITKYDNPNGVLSQYYVGREFGEIWGYTSNGLFQSEQEIEQAPNQTKLWGGNWAPGDARYVDLNEDGEISPGQNTLNDPGDLSIIGNSTPRYSFGVRGGMDWKNFSLSFIFQGVGKRDYMPGGNYFWGLTSEWAVPQQHNLDYWTPENTDAYWPRPRFGHGGNHTASTRYIQDAAYIRWKQLTIGYNIPDQLLERMNIDNLMIYFSGENLWESTNLLDAYDPEILNAATYPIQRTLSVGLNVTL